MCIRKPFCAVLFYGGLNGSLASLLFGINVMNCSFRI